MSRNTRTHVRVSSDVVTLLLLRLQLLLSDSGCCFVSRVMSRNTRLCFVCCMRERVNICGNAPSNITRSSDWGRPQRHPTTDRTSSVWARDSDTGLCCWAAVRPLDTCYCDIRYWVLLTSATIGVVPRSVATSFDAIASGDRKGTRPLKIHHLPSKILFESNWWTWING